MSKQRSIQISLPNIGKEEWLAVKAPIFSGWLTQGPKVAEFEKAFGQRHETKYALATTSCTTSLHLILCALGIGPGDEVIIPAFTWVATANVVIHCGATPVFVDVCRDTFNIDPSLIRNKLSKHTKAIIVVHLFGLCADMDEIKAVIPDDIKIIEDAACAAGASYKGRSAGSLGDAAGFSFHPRKVMTTGEGGMITTNRKYLAETANQLRNHGASIAEEQRHLGSKPYVLPAFNMLGFNYRMTDMQGAVGLVQLRKLDEFIQERQKWGEYYNTALSKIPWLRLPFIPDNGQHAWQAYVVFVDEISAPFTRNEIMEILQNRGISTRPGTHAVHKLSYIKKRYKYNDEDFPAANDCDKYSMAIPLHNKMTSNDFAYVSEALLEINGTK